MDRKSYPGLKYTKYTDLLDPNDPILAPTPDTEQPVPPEIDVPEPIEPEEPSPTERKSSSDMTIEEQDLFKDAISHLNSIGQYGEHVFHHTVMSHRMHGSMAGDIGFERFLSWHRIYLLKLEGLLRNFDDRVFIPYWDWTVDRAIPSWLADFTPEVQLPNGEVVNVTRDPGTPNSLPSPLAVDTILAIDNWHDFVRALENGPHNRVHGWAGGSGGTMNDIRVSPADPIFWLHHGEVDRIWHRWQELPANGGKKSPVVGPDAILDPWPETIDDSQDIVALGFKYV